MGLQASLVVLYKKEKLCLMVLCKQEGLCLVLYQQEELCLVVLYEQEEMYFMVLYAGGAVPRGPCTSRWLCTPRLRRGMKT